jgi:hypothetical protein
MTRRSMWTALLVVSAVGFSVAAQSQKREIVLNLNLPNGATPQLRISDGEMGTVTLPDLGKFGFVPTIGDADARAVTVELFDLNRAPDRRLSRMELTVGAATVQSETTPKFGLRVDRVIAR